MKDLIPINDLSRRTRKVSDLLIDRITNVLDSGHLILGSQTDQLEKKLAQMTRHKFAIAVGSGTDALTLGLRALGAAPGVTVFTTPNAGGYTTTAAKLNSAEVKYVDTDVDGSMSALDLKTKLSQSAGRSIVVVTHLFGLMTNTAQFRQICDSFGASMVEDCAQAIGAKESEVSAGQLADLATFSFYPTKNLGAIGDGGAIVTSDSSIAGNLRMIRQYGWGDRYEVLLEGGTNSRMDEIQAAAILLGFEDLEERNQIRRNIWQQYSLALSSSRWSIIGVPTSRFVAHLAVLVAPPGLRDATKRNLESKEIATSIHYPILDYMQPAWKQEVTCSNAEDMVDRILTVPLFPELRTDEVAHVANALKSLESELG